MSSLRTSILAASSALVALYAVACAAPTAQKTLVVDCDKSSADSSCEEGTTKKSGSKSSSSSDTESESSANETSATPSASASSSASAAPSASGSGSPTGLGFYCGKLDACCKALAKKGITGSANQCTSVVSTKNEFACDTTFQTYKTPDEAYDPPAECQ